MEWMPQLRLAPVSRGAAICDFITSHTGIPYGDSAAL